MSIVCYAGLPRQGKSYSAVLNFIIPALKDKRHVATNMELNLPALEVVCGHPVKHLVHTFSKEATAPEVVAACPPGAVIVIDEVWRYWPAGTKAADIPREELAFFKEHGHRQGAEGISTEICIIDQDPKTAIPAWLRALIELTYLHTKLSALGLSKRFRVEVYSKCQSAEKPAKSAHLRTLQGKYQTDVFNCYVTHTQSAKIGEVGLEKAVDGRANLWRGWTLRGAIVALVLLPFLAWFTIGALMDFAGSKPKLPPTSEPFTITPEMQTGEPLAIAQPPQAPLSVGMPSAAVAPLSVVASEPEGPQRSTVWRILGVAAHKDGTGVALLASATGRRRLDLKKFCTYQADALDWECEVDGETVTYWSGSRLGGDFNAAVVPGTASAENMPKT